MISKIKMIMAGGAAAAIAVSAWWVTQNYYTGKIAEMNLAIAEKTIKLQKANREKEALGRKLSDRTAELLAAEMSKLQIVEREVEVEVIKYVQSSDAGKCSLPSNFVMLHDKAATGSEMSSSTNSTSAPNGASTGFTDVDLLPVVTDNYSMYRDCQAKLNGWIYWATGLKLWSGDVAPIK